ncbi:MAG TPA: HAD-IA family hydrolase [Sphingomonas sp.]|nr:HAD-IA family hydrolase [Sphingomonas sp.]
MTDFPFHLVGFDLDGTLVDSSADLAAAVNHVLAGLGCPPLSEAQVRQNIGGGGRRMLAMSLADAGIEEPEALDARYAALLAYYEEHIADATRPYPDVAEALDELAALGVRLAVVTNKGGRLATKLLDALGLLDRFACVIGGDAVARGKPAPDPILEMIRRRGGGRAAFVGDSTFDVEAAHAAGLPCVAVSFGFADRPVERLGADAVIGGYGELVSALRGL